MSFDLFSGFDSSDLMSKVPQEPIKKDYTDRRFWKISKNEQGSGTAVIRLITDKNKIPYTRVYHYSAKKKIKDKEYWLIADAPSTINLPDPIQEHFFNLRNNGQEELSKMFARKTKFICNILVIKDPANPSNEGKVFLWEFGTKLKEKFTKWMQPSDADIAIGEKPKELFNPLTGHDIKLSIRKDGQFYTYDDTSVMSTPSRLNHLGDSDEDIETIRDIIVNKTYDLSEFTKPERFESYETLKARLDKFINPFGNTKNTPSAVPSAAEKNEKLVDESEEVAEPVKPTTVKAKKVETPVDTTDSGDDDWLDKL